MRKRKSQTVLGSRGQVRSCFNVNSKTWSWTGHGENESIYRDLKFIYGSEHELNAE